MEKLRRDKWKRETGKISRVVEVVKDRHWAFWNLKSLVFSCYLEIPIMN